MITKGSKVSIHYSLTVEGQVVDSSEGKEPLTFVQGTGQIIPGLDKEIVGLKAGDKKTVVVAPELGYGPRNPDALQKVPPDAFQNSDKIKAGDVVQGNVQGKQFQAVVASIDKDAVTLDLNHPLAGKTLNFEIEIVKVEAS
jgi:FKBP-type peptidyl-prolyl cis-trans isomerase SlyD